MIRRWLLWIALILFVWLVVSRFNELERLAQALSHGQWTWVAIAAGLQVLYYLMYSLLYQSSFDTVDVRSRVPDLLPLVLASVFVNVAAPSGGASGGALFVNDAARRGESPARTAAGVLLATVADFGAFLVILVIGVVHLFLMHDLQAYEVAGAIALVFMTIGLGSLLLIGLWRPQLLVSLLGLVQRAANGAGLRLRGQPFLAEDFAERSARDFAQAAGALRAHPWRLARTLLVAFASHAADLATVFALFLAFHQAPDLGVLVTGYAMGVLFWIVSLTPQGIGVVEGVMALVYTSLGVPAERATLIALSFRGLTFWLPMIIGFLVIRRLRAFGSVVGPRPEKGGVRTVAALTGLMGVVNVLSGVTPSLTGRLATLTQYVPLFVRHGSHLASTLLGFALLLLAAGLWRRKRTAWWLTVLALALSMVSHFLKGLDWEEALLAAGLLIWLLTLRSRFHARSDPPSIRQGLTILAASLAFTLAYGAVGFDLLDHHFRVNFGLGMALRQTVVMFTQFSDLGLEPLTGFGRYFGGSIYAVAAATFGFSLFMLIRPVLVRHPATPTEHRRARAIVEAYGRSSLARMALFEDKAYFFTTGGSVIAFAARGRAAVALGDPIGPSDDLAAAISGFQSLCRSNDWLPSFGQTLPETLDEYRRAGLDALCIGHEAIVSLKDFSLEGRAHKDLRSAVRRMARLGYRTQLFVPPHSQTIMGMLESVSDEWLTHQHGSEKGFSVGWFDPAYLQDGPVMTVLSPREELTAFANLVPEYQLPEVTIDLMRHRRDAEHGTMDFLFAALLQWSASEGYNTFNLGLSSLAGIGERAEDPTLEKALHFIYEHVNQFYNFKGLHTFKAKFKPEWSPRYLIYPGSASLPTVLTALLRAESGPGGFGRGLGARVKNRVALRMPDDSSPPTSSGTSLRPPAGR